MIYRRRALQRRLDELRNTLGGEDVDKLAARLNRAGKDRIAAMWEVVVLHGLSRCGDLQNEMPLTSLRRPDIFFKQDTLHLIADVTTVSDDGLDDKNPYRELAELIERAKNSLGLPLGGLHLNVHAKHENTKRGVRTVLLLPPQSKLQDFVRNKIVPRMREQLAAGRSPVHITIEDGDTSLDITIDPAKSPYSSGTFSAYDVPKIKDRNPLYSALKAKAEQLRGADGITGIIIGDGDCVALSDRSAGWDEVTVEQIVAEFFRQHSSVDFVLLLSIRERQSGWASLVSPSRSNYMFLDVRDGCDAGSALKALFLAMLEHFPKPAMMPVNGALRARESGYDLGYHGGYSLSSSNVVRISLREFTEVLAGLRTFEDNGARNVEAARKLAQQREINPVQSIALRNLVEGRLPTSIEIIKTGENGNDDWVEIRFGDRDPAIAPLR